MEYKEIVCLYSVEGPGEWCCIVLALPVTQNLFKVYCLKEIPVVEMSHRRLMHCMVSLRWLLSSSNLNPCPSCVCSPLQSV